MRRGHQAPATSLRGQQGPICSCDLRFNQEREGEELGALRDERDRFGLIKVGHRVRLVSWTWWPRRLGWPLERGVPGG
jgi:hypothetical protein